MHFYQSHSIHITNLEFIGRGGNQVRHIIEEFVIKDAKFEGQENSGAALELIKTTVIQGMFYIWPCMSMGVHLIDSLVVQLLQLPTVAAVEIS